MAFAGEPQGNIGRFGACLGMESRSKVVNAVLLIEIFKSELKICDGLYLIGQNQVHFLLLLQNASLDTQ